MEHSPSFLTGEMTSFATECGKVPVRMRSRTGWGGELIDRESSWVGGGAGGFPGGVASIAGIQIGKEESNSLCAQMA